MTILPFVCLFIGIIFGILVKNKNFVKYSEKISTIALSLLMLVIGLGIGIDKTIMNNLLKIGINCIIISFLAITFSVIFTVICEKTVLPLKEIEKELENQNIIFEKINNNIDIDEEKKEDNLVWIMPISLMLGLFTGFLLQDKVRSNIIDFSFTVFLTIIYICVGISQGSDKAVLVYLKKLGFRMIWLSLAILLGSMIGGIIAGKILNIPLKISLISASGMSYYSLTGAFMVKTFGLEIGTYGFIVNIMREVLTILFMPFLIKISVGSPIAGGAAGNMDTMLMPVTKFVGSKLGMVTLLTGTILTFIVPFLLPILASIL
ncbi:lysine exporter LysO family protein [Fusobacterium sp. SYSU M8D902]|uniref:lysine exporter LysO family protein n=1 Tax=Fusobacterium sp. SYSU M8D902 TaxID=3159562 RepID=UPI0032E49061